MVGFEFARFACWIGRPSILRVFLVMAVVVYVGFSVQDEVCLPTRALLIAYVGGRVTIPFLLSG